MLQEVIHDGLDGWQHLHATDGQHTQHSLARTDDVYSLGLDHRTSC